MLRRFSSQNLTVVFFTAYGHSTAVGFPASLLAKFDIWLTKPGIYCFEVGTREANGQGTYRLEVESHGYNHNYDVPADTSTKKTITTPVTRTLDGGLLGDHEGLEPDEGLVSGFLLTVA